MSAVEFLPLKLPSGDFVDAATAQDDVGNQRIGRAEAFGELRQPGVGRQREGLHPQALVFALLFAFEAVDLVVGEIHRFHDVLWTWQRRCWELFFELVVGHREGLRVVRTAEDAVAVGRERRDVVVVEVGCMGATSLPSGWSVSIWFLDRSSRLIFFRLLNDSGISLRLLLVA